jgi:hypothetical protein
MQQTDLYGYQTELDPAATQGWYASAGAWDCPCDDCRNFVKLAKLRALPAPILETLASLGIPPEKATYVGELYTDGAGIHYQFSYRLCGAIRSAPERETDDPYGSRCCHEPYPHGAPGFPTPHFDLEFFATLPRAL